MWWKGSALSVCLPLCDLTVPLVRANSVRVSYKLILMHKGSLWMFVCSLGSTFLETYGSPASFASIPFHGNPFFLEC